MKIVSAISQGRAAEHLVVADLLMHGVGAFLTAEGAPYDVIVEHEHTHLDRIQVKSAATFQTIKGGREGYRFNTVTGRKDKREPLNRGACDIVALVAMDTREIAYLLVEEIGGASTVIYRPGQAPVFRENKNIRPFARPMVFDGSLSFAGYRKRVGMELAA